MNFPHIEAGADRAKVENIRGVFSTQEIRRVGTGTTTRKTVQKSFWFVEQNAEGTIESQPLNANYVPSGPKRIITLEELIDKFAPEPEYYLSSVYPKMQELQRTIDKADEHRDKGETFAAEFEYETALKVDEDNVRANFGIGLTYLQRGETGKADDIFQRLVNLDAAFETEHKHLFNDFGINLRKNKLFTQAVTYYGRALELTQNDENLHMNMARALLETKDLEGCTQHLLNALDLVPTHENALKFLQWLQTKNLVPVALQAQVTAKLPPPPDAASSPETCS
ncbi:MAG: hypothetical protein RRY29_02765 [Desulfovibrionaceae bacterium]